MEDARWISYFNAAKAMPTRMLWYANEAHVPAPICVKAKDDMSDPRTSPSPLLLRRLLGSAAVSTAAAASPDVEFQKSCPIERAWPWLYKRLTVKLNMRSESPPQSVISTSCCEDIIGDTRCIFGDRGSTCIGVSQGVEKTAEGFDSDTGPEEVATENLGLEDGNGGGRIRTEIPRARLPSHISEALESFDKPERSHKICNMIEASVHLRWLNKRFHPWAFVRSVASLSIAIIFEASPTSITNPTRAAPS